MSLDRFLVIVIVVHCCSCSYAKEAEWKYLDPTSVGPMATLRISAEGNVVAYNEHVGRNWTDCDPQKEKYAVCFESPELFMKLPYSALSIGEWTEDGVTYSASQHNDVHLFGQALGDIYVVSMESQDKRGFIFSPNRGVVGIFFSQARSFEVAIIVGQCGYGAPASCYEGGQ